MARSFSKNDEQFNDSPSRVLALIKRFFPFLSFPEMIPSCVHIDYDPLDVNYFTSCVSYFERLYLTILMNNNNDTGYKRSIDARYTL